MVATIERRSRLRVLLVVVLLALSACSAGADVDREQLTAEMNASLSQAITDQDFDLRVRQAEFQGDGDELAWITQFDDPVGTGGLSGASAETLIFEQPLVVFKDAIAENEAAMRAAGADVFIITFRDQQQTVFELEPELVWEFASSDLDWTAVVDRMTITGM